MPSAIFPNDVNNDYGPRELYSKNDFDGPIYRKYRPGLYKVYWQDMPCLSAGCAGYERDTDAERYAKLGRKLMDAIAGPRYGLYTRILHILKDEIAVDIAEVDAIARLFAEEGKNV